MAAIGVTLPKEIMGLWYPHSISPLQNHPPQNGVRGLPETPASVWAWLAEVSIQRQEEEKLKVGSGVQSLLAVLFASSSESRAPIWGSPYNPILAMALLAKQV